MLLSEAFKIIVLWIRRDVLNHGGHQKSSGGKLFDLHGAEMVACC